MIHLFRRMLLVSCILLAVTLSLWTPGPVIRVSLAQEGVVGAVERRDAPLQALAAVLYDVANRTSKDASMRARLAEGQADRLDSTVAPDPHSIRFYFAPGEEPWPGLAGDLAPGERTFLRVPTAGGERTLEVTLCAQARATDAPAWLVYPWAASDVPGWLVLAGVLGYGLGGLLVRRKDVVPLDPRVTFLQTALGVLLAAGFWSMALMRSDPSPEIFRHLGAGTLVCLGGAVAGALLLVHGAARASRTLVVGEDRLVIRGLLSAGALVASQVTGILKDRARHVFIVSRAADRPLLIPIAHHAAGRAIRVLGGDSRVQVAGPSGGERGILAWAFRRLLPALVLGAALGAVMGFFRAGSAFMVGIQGMLAGMALGGMAGYFARWDHPADYGRGRQLLAALAVAGAFMLGQLAGISLAMEHGSGWDWLLAMLKGDAHEQVLGYRRYRWSAAEFRPGPVGWVLLNLLDAGFLFAFAWVLLGANLAREPVEALREEAPAA